MLLRVVLRVLLSVLGATVAAAVVGLLEARDALLLATGEGGAPERTPLALTELGLLFPAAAGVGVGVLAATLVLDPGGPTSPTEIAKRLRAGDVLTRLCRAALAPLGIVATFASTIAIAHAARGILAHGSPAQTGPTLATATLGIVLLALATVFALLPAVRRALAVASGSLPALLDPVRTGAAALGLVLLLGAFGIATGDTGGEGGVLGVLGVLKRPELDLRPVSHLVVVALGAYAFPILIAPAHEGRLTMRRSALASGAVGFLLLVGHGLLLGRASGSMGDTLLVTRAIERHAALGKVSLAVLRRATDRDHDGFSGRFGGGDCDDRDPTVNPSAVDVPGNGKDEDCSGADTPAVVAPERPAKDAAAAAKRLPATKLNVLLVTIDTLRKDLGFMGYGKPVSPALDALAAESTVFERAYAMASYTGKSIGPMLIGKYPSETRRNFSHFDTYAPQNTFVAERLHAAGVRTFAAHCHWYFKNPSGLSQGFDVWDTSALPPGMGDNDTSITSDRMLKSATALLEDPANTDGQFFGWLHFFDPHAQYVAHPGAPEVLASPTARNLYDQEIWFTDQAIGKVLELVRSKPWGKNTAVVVTADHGEAFGEHGMSWHGREIWEPLVRVPLVVYVPSASPHRVAARRSHIDLVPTILELLGAPPPDDPSELRGESLLPDVFPAEGEAPVERDVYVDMPEGPFNDVRRALVFGEGAGTKLLHLGGASYQLFDLAADPDEKQDLARDRPRLREAIDRLQAFRGKLVEIAVKKPEN